MFRVLLVNHLARRIMMPYNSAMHAAAKAENKDVRVPVMMSPTEAKAIDDWRRHLDDLPSRSEAVRRLIQMALQTAAAPRAGNNDDT